MDGLTLKLLRVRARLRQRDVARAAGYSRARIAQLELLASVPPHWVARYREGITQAKRADAGNQKAVSEVKPETAREGGTGDAARSR